MAMAACEELDDVDFVGELILQFFASGRWSASPRFEESLILDGMRGLALTIEQVREIRRRMTEQQRQLDALAGGAA